MNNRMFEINRQYFLLLLPVFFVFHNYEQNFPSVPFSDAVTLTVTYLFISLFLLIIGFFIFKSYRRSGIFTFFLMFVQFFFGAFQDLMKKMFGDFFISKYSFLLPLLLIISLIVFVYLFKTRRQFSKLIKYLNIALIILIFVDASALLFKINQQKSIGISYNFHSCDTCKKPNIYLIIADEYAGRKELRDVFSFDNSAFENELLKRGFLVVKNPRSNYNFTPFSMASTLSMNYLKGITTKSNDINNRNICLKNINENDLTKTFQKLGYKFINLSLFDFADQPTPWNNNGFYSTRGKIITSQTLTGRIKKDLSYHLITTFHFKWFIEEYSQNLISNIKNSYEKTIAASRDNSTRPKFIYSHFIMPHYPYLYDKNGNRLPFQESVQGSRKDLYLGFLQYSNTLCLSMIDSILKNDRSHPIIILMSDHGFTKYTTEYDPAYNFQNMINIYLPDKNYSKFPNDLTNVNLFRILLNTQFHQQLPLLKDSTIFLREY